MLPCQDITTFWDFAIMATLCIFTYYLFKFIGGKLYEITQD